MKLYSWSVAFWSRLMIFGFSCQLTLGGEVLQEFAYREVTLKVAQADGKPIPGASIYGFCRELNLVWRPGRDHQSKKQDHVLWRESSLGKTGLDGSLKAVVPPGKWGFFAAGIAEDHGHIVAAWTDFRPRSDGDVIQLSPTLTKSWVLCSGDLTNLEPKRLFLKPEGFPIWIPASVSKPTEPLQMEMTPGRFHMWAAGDATADHPGFVMEWGLLSDHVADGKLLAPDKAAVLQCKGGQGKASLSWFRRSNSGLDGELNLCNDAKVLFTPGLFSLAYRRPVAAGVTGEFAGQCYNLRTVQPFSLNMETPLCAELDQALSEPNKQNESKLFAQLYLVDGNGHLLTELFDFSNRHVDVGAAVVLNEQRFSAHQVFKKVEISATDEEEASTEQTGQMLFAANVGTIRSDVGAAWDFTAPQGMLAQVQLTKSQQILVTSRSFRMEVPQGGRQAAENILTQAEELATGMQAISGRKRKASVTTIKITTGGGASASHSGTHINFNTRLFHMDQPMFDHAFVHELGHNFDFYHGGLHETAVEAVRCAGQQQISGQQAKWMFMDRMNGMAGKEVPYKYPNVGLYFYCYSLGGGNFLRFLSVNEDTVLHKLKKQGYTENEIRTALLGLALGRDMTRICRNYGFDIAPERVAEATRAARVLCRTY